VTLTWAAVVVAAGRGERLGRSKQLLEVAGLPLVGWSVQTLAEMPEVAELIVVTETDWIEAMRQIFARLAPQRAIHVAAGGASRQESVYNGLRVVPKTCRAVLVHDGARPLVRPGDVRAGMREVREGRAALLAVPVIDTIKVVDPGSSVVVDTLDRSMLWAAQTPQFALTADLVRAHERARREGVEATDDAALLEAIGIEVVAVSSSSENFKVTWPDDVARAEAVLQRRAPIARSS
jgi:2-C-methyl-D-erythritol 4-phosphate cytidylyltransferase